MASDSAAAAGGAAVRRPEAKPEGDSAAAGPATVAGPDSCRRLPGLWSSETPGLPGLARLARTENWNRGGWSWHLREMQQTHPSFEVVRSELWPDFQEIWWTDEDGRHVISLTNTGWREWRRVKQAGKESSQLLELDAVLLALPEEHHTLVLAETGLWVRIRESEIAELLAKVNALHGAGRLEDMRLALRKLEQLVDRTSWMAIRLQSRRDSG